MRENERKEKERDGASRITYVYNKVCEGAMCGSEVYRDTDNDVVTYAQA